MPITITYHQIIIGILLLVLSYGSLATESNTLIKDITFNRGENGEGIITISLPNQDVAPSISERQGKIIVNLPNTALPELLQKEINVVESKTPIQRISPISQNKNTIINILPIRNFNYSATQLNNLFIITLWNSPEQPKVRIENNDQFKSNDYISLNLHNAEIRTILKILADDKKINLVVTDSVTGKMTLRTQGMTWEQVLDIVLKANNLDKRLEGNILFIAPVEEFLASSRKLFDEEHVICGDNRPHHRKLFPIKYIDAKTIIEIFTQQKSKDEQNDRGSLAVDKRTNTIIAHQTPENFELLNKIIKELDVQKNQIQIEARVVETNKEYVQYLKTQVNQKEETDLLLYKMQKQGKGEVISQPKVTTNNKEFTRITKGEEICHAPCTKTRSEITLNITPEIVNANQVKLVIEASFQPNNSKKASTLIKKQYEKIVEINKTIILDQLGYYREDDDQSMLMITITPKIVQQKPFLVR